MIGSKKSLFVAVLHFVTAGITLVAGIYLCFSLFYGNLLQFENVENDLSTGIGNVFVAVFALMFLLCSFAGILMAIPSFIFSGCKLMAQAQGQLPSKRSFIVTLVLKTIAFAVMLFTLIFMFELPNGLTAAVLHILMLSFSLASSLLEAYVRRRP